MTAAPDFLKVSEIFGPTFQGEGPSLGRRVVFLRLALCNLACTWCDTPYTWDWKRFNPSQEIQRLYYEDVATALAAMPCRDLVISGGEPLLQQPALTALLHKLSPHFHSLGPHWRIEVETAGTIKTLLSFESMVQQFNVSPKLAHSGNALSDRYKPEVLRDFVAMRKAYFKFVVRGDTPEHMKEDLEEVTHIGIECGIPPERIFIMPEGVSASPLCFALKNLADEVLKRGWNLTTRLHVLIWGSKRGV